MINKELRSPLASVIVLNWNGKRFLNKCIASLLNQNCRDYEVLFVDNGSVDDSIEFVRSHFGDNPKLRIIDLGYNYGFSKGNNLGISHALGKYLIILNNDTEVEPNFVSELVAVAEADRTVGSVSCKILHYDGTVWFGQYFTHRGFIVPFFMQAFSRDFLNELYTNPSTNLANSGCAVLYRSDVIAKIGGFDEDFWTDWEDYDLGFRTNISGYRSVYIPIPLVLHLGGGSAGSSPKRFVRVYKNMLSTYFKNYESINLIFRFPLIMFMFVPFMHIGWFIHRLITSPPDFYKGKEAEYVVTLPKGFLGFLANLKVYAKKRYYIQQLRQISDRNIFKNTEVNHIL